MGSRATTALALLLTIGAPRPATALDGPRAPTYEVLRVVDGDTVVLRIDGRPTTVRLIGVDTPETVHPSKPVERFGVEASAFLHGLLDGRSARLEWEPGADYDRYGRTLAYLVSEPDGLAVNREVVARGYGHAYTLFPFGRMEDFRAAERGARDAGSGLWGPDPATDGKGVVTGAADATTVYVTRTGRKHHRAGCRSLAKSSIPTPLAEAAERYGACAVCGPPRIK